MVAVTSVAAIGHRPIPIDKIPPSLDIEVLESLMEKILESGVQDGDHDALTVETHIVKRRHVDLLELAKGIPVVDGESRRFLAKGSRRLGRIRWLASPSAINAARDRLWRTKGNVASSAI